MELSHIKLKNSNRECIDAPIYANTIISTESVAHTTNPKSGDSGQNEGLYEKLRLGTKQNEAKPTQNASRSLHWEDIPNRIKYAVYAIIAVIVVLFVAVIVLIVLIALPKNTVDGNWIQWSPWSNCDVTCNYGKQTRMRFCINPAPSNGGIDCSGKSVDTKQCKNDGCSVHGSWGRWSPWGSCTVSCGIGMEWRDRTCSRPYPSRNGNQCYGESRDHRICIPARCSDGDWSRWGSWGSCSDSCDGGVRTRLRTCTNPTPSLLGRFCNGSPEQVIPCNKQACSDGDWSSWGSWGSCSDSCNGGVRSRLRTCTDPRPSMLGRYCDGSPEQVMSCNPQACPDHKVAFTAYGTKSTNETSRAAIKFPYTYLNIGGGYNTSTGRFTCKIPGIYNFAVTLTKKRVDIDRIDALLSVNSSAKLQLHSDPDDTHDDHADYGSYSLSVAGNIHLNKNDYVYVYGVPSHFYNSYSTSFTGVLVIPDE